VLDDVWVQSAGIDKGAKMITALKLEDGPAQFTGDDVAVVMMRGE
jgi:hypothetical protein